MAPVLPKDPPPASHGALATHEGRIGCLPGVACGARRKPPKHSVRGESLARETLLTKKLCLRGMTL